MSIDDLFDNRCDIYHVIRESASPGYKLPPSGEYRYNAVPDIAGLPCHFGLKYRDTAMTQHEPENRYYSRVKLALPAGTDVRLNDKIVDIETGLEYTAQVPRNIRGNHITVFVKRTSLQEAL